MQKNLFMNILSKPDTKNDSKKKQRKYFIHDMLATFRDEKVPFWYNKRHEKIIEKNMHIERPVFDKWKADTDELVV